MRPHIGKLSAVIAVLAVWLAAVGVAQATTWTCKASGQVSATATGTVGDRTSQWEMSGSGTCTSSQPTESSPVSISGQGSSDLGYCAYYNGEAFEAAQLRMNVTITPASDGAAPPSEQWYVPVVDAGGATPFEPFLVSSGGQGRGEVQWGGYCNSGLSDEGIGQFTNGDPASMTGYGGPDAFPSFSASWTVS
jgi:hypothetical protein